MKLKKTCFLALLFLFCSIVLFGQEKQALRKIHYAPEGNSFVLKNGTRKFNRALYGSNTGFRVETGDLPEFAMYMPGMGGNFKLGIVNGKSSKWITEASKIDTRYILGTMHYEIQDAILETGTLYIDVVALKEKEGFIVKVYGKKISQNTNIIWAFGGATGKKFSRDGDIGADPESVFYLQPEYCLGNKYTLKKQSFLLEYGSESNKQKSGNNKSLVGFFPESSTHLANAKQQTSPLELYNSNQESLPVITGNIKKITEKGSYWLFATEDPKLDVSQDGLVALFEKSVGETQLLANRVKVTTPDPYINTLGSALAIASDGIWESPAYLHGAIAWRMYLNAWRGAYTADPLGWHDRAKSHFKSYSNSQVLTPESGPVVFDSIRNLARQKEEIGTSMFSSGYISRSPNKNTVAHHYDMNLVFIDEMLRHFKWTGDISFMKEMWPTIQRHLKWEKRNFDADNDGIYDAYACIWASDALQYSGGGVIHSSAYNYYANKMVAETAKKIQEDPIPFSKEADKILKATNAQLWIPNKGIFAEYKDALGNKLLHETPGIWSIYHTIDSELSTPFESYQMLNYVDTQIPHIPISAEGLDKKDLYVISTTNWQPYTWSVNNVALAEQLHTSLAFWQGGQSDKAFKMWESALIESMYLGASPGGFEQLLYQDAIRGELYRDFADPIGMASRTLVEGLFGIQPDALAETLTIKPGFPSNWNYASLEIPDISIDFKRENKEDNYHIENRLVSKMNLKLIVSASFETVETISVNGKNVSWKAIPESIGTPKISIEVSYSANYDISIKWKGNYLEDIHSKLDYGANEILDIKTSHAKIISIYDPQNILTDISKTHNLLKAKVNSVGNKVFFIELNQGELSWWKPIQLNIKPIIESDKREINWDIPLDKSIRFETVSLSSFFNSKVTDIFNYEYVSPRPKTTTLQLPKQGIGNWCYPNVSVKIDDKGLREKAKQTGEITTPNGIRFQTPSDENQKNIIFTSMWDNFPESISIPLNGKASHIYFMMAGTTNPMQSRMINGEIKVNYTDGTSDILPLKNPENWWPIEQDYFIDGLAFTTDAPKPPRVYFKTGEISRDFKNFISIKGYSNYGIDGGAGTILELPLDKNKTLKSMTLKTIANDVVIGLMSMTLSR
ncbi:glycogen debranching protein [Flavobacteriaceae bacterium CRH]|nr:glycogen debranching protein [Flavobacteriaceae bacterium CRH]